MFVFYESCVLQLQAFTTFRQNRLAVILNKDLLKYRQLLPILFYLQFFNLLLHRIELTPLLLFKKLTLALRIIFLLLTLILTLRPILVSFLITVIIGRIIGIQHLYQFLSTNQRGYRIERPLILLYTFNEGLRVEVFQLTICLIKIKFQR